MGFDDCENSHSSPSSKDSHRERKVVWWWTIEISSGLVKNNQRWEQYKNSWKFFMDFERSKCLKEQYTEKNWKALSLFPWGQCYFSSILQTDFFRAQRSVLCPLGYMTLWWTIFNLRVVYIKASSIHWNCISYQSPDTQLNLAMKIYESWWKYRGIHGKSGRFSWIFIDNHGSLWTSVVIHHVKTQRFFGWQSMKVHGQNHEYFHGHWGYFIVFYDITWIFVVTVMDIHGSWWIFVAFHRL